MRPIDPKTITVGGGEALPTAVEKTRHVPDPSPATTVEFAAIRAGKPLSRRALIDSRAIQVTPSTVALVAAEADFGEGFKNPAPDELDALFDLEQRMRAISAIAEAHGPRSADAEYFRQRDAVHNASLLETAQMDSKSHIQLTFRARYDGALKQLAKLTAEELVPLAGPILARFADGVEKWCRAMEEDDRTLCLALDLPYEPSLLWKVALTVAAAYSTRRIPRHEWSWVFPSSALQGLVNFSND